MSVIKGYRVVTGIFNAVVLELLPGCPTRIARAQASDAAHREFNFRTYQTNEYLLLSNLVLDINKMGKRMVS